MPRAPPGPPKSHNFKGFGTPFYITASNQLPYHINLIIMIEFSLKYHFEMHM